MSSSTFAATRSVAATRAVRGIAVAMLVIAATNLAPTGDPASAGIVPTVSLATAANYSVLAATTVTNANSSVLGGSVGLSPGSAIVGFPPGIVLPPATIEAANAATLQAQVDLTTAYVDAAGRGVEFTQTNPDLVGQLLVPGVYAAAAKAPLQLSGQVVLDGQGDSNAVFIFQTDSTLITASGSTVELINGASQCNVFWQVGSSATIGSGSVFVGNILALTSITVASSAVVHGRALARNGAVTLDNNVFDQPSCAPSTATVAPSTTTTIAGAPTTAAGTPTTVEASTTSLVTSSDVATIPITPSTPDFTVITLPSTGKSTGTTSALAGAVFLVGAAAVLAARRRRHA